MALLSSVSQALRVLDLLQGEEELGVTEVAARLGLSTSSTHRLLNTLAAAHYVRQVRAGGKYRLGPAMQGAEEASAIDHCVEVALPHMQRLRDSSGETVHVVALKGSKVKFVAAMESQQTMRVTNRAGHLLPANATAAGKLLLSLLPPAEVDRLLGTDLPSSTDLTITDLAELHAELGRTAAAGYGRNYSEAELGVAALAVPIRRPEGRVLCALTLTGPDSRFNPGHRPGVSVRERELLTQLQGCADRISAELSV